MINSVNKILYSSEQNTVKIHEARIKDEKETSKQKFEETTTSPDADVVISDYVYKPINSLIAKEDELTQKLYTAQNIYDMLGEIRVELGNLVKTLKNTDIKHDISSLEELNNLSNNLITKAIDIVRNDNATGIANSFLINSYLKGLSSIKELKISETEYITQLETILKDIKNEEANYYELTNNLYSDLNTISSKFENFIPNTSHLKTDFLANEIIKNNQQTLFFTSERLSKDIVQNLLSKKT